MMMWIIRRPHVIHPVRAPALLASSNGMFARHEAPADDVRVGGETGAAGELFVAEGFDADRVGEGSCYATSGSDQGGGGWR